ncbi:DNA topoisomerase [Limosilactobacillus reuteri]|uniref:DNA topoisomerase n=1 Tax=Limosilactobacillus reuteri TaxID=1598 RepID=UPI001E54D519|nr:DNA topoisomerase [Limosilactobacillus reuteri]
MQKGKANNVYDYLILTEKKTEYDAFVTALGGETGTFNGHTFIQAHSQGHLLELDEPENMVMPALKEKYHVWDLKNLPWDLNDFNWHKVVKKDNKTGKPAAYAVNLLKNIKKASQQARAIVIATDTDETTGEGELLAWEIINYIGWRGPVYREYHDDESSEAIRRAMADLHDVSDPQKDGWFVKGTVRQRWDFGSMPLTRAATFLVRDAGYYTRSINEGRLKSVMLSAIFQRLNAIKNYVKRPYYEVRFQDQHKHVFARKIDKNNDELIKKVHHENEAMAKEEQHQYQSPVGITIDGQKTVYQAPHTFTDLTKIDAILSHKGYTSKMIQDTYQLLYQNYHYLSYPRSDDKTVTEAQFAELVQNSKKIASLVGVDLQLLTHLAPRKGLVEQSATHGANRPGSVVPNSLDDLRKPFNTKKQQDCAIDIYTLVAKAALAILGEDYEYQHITAHLTDYPEFQCSFNQPVKYNNKQIYHRGKLPQVGAPLGQQATSFIYSGANSKPSWPTKEWLYNRLDSFKYSIGTPATQQSTLTEISDSNGKTYLVTQTKEKLNLTQQGLMAAIMAQGTYIASPQITVQLFQAMQAVGKFKMKPKQVLQTVDQVTKHDLPVMVKNVALLKKLVKLPKKKDPNDYVLVHYKGKPVKIKKTWGEHTWTPEELNTLDQGGKVTFQYKNHPITGGLKLQTYQGHKFVAFKADFKKKRSKK